MPSESNRQPGHALLLWENEEFLNHRLAQFAADALSSGRGLVILTQPAQIAAVRVRLGAMLAAAERSGRAVLLSAPDAFPTLLTEGMPDKAKFQSTLRQATASVAPDGGPVSFYGDLITIPCDNGQHEQSVDIESWVQELYEQEAPRIQMLCAYPFHALAAQSLEGVVHAICGHHTGTPIVEGFPEDASPEARLAYAMRQQQLLRSLEEEVRSRRRAEKQLQAHQVNLEHLVQERTQRLVEAYQEMESFAHTASHDLKAPVRVLQGFAHMLRRSHAGELSAQAREVVEGMGRAATDLGQTLAGLEQLAGLNAAPMKVDNVDLSLVARDVLRAIAASDPARKVEVHVDEGMRIHADPLLLRLLLHNLLENAWKYTRTQEHPRIEVRGLSGTNGSGASVIDNGVGFEAGQSHRLFQTFSRLHQGSFEGHGIGLATARRVVQRHGGHVWAQGTPGKGARFSFIFPVKPLGAPPPHDHVLRFFESDQSLGAHVGGFLQEASRNGEAVLVVATPEHHLLLEPYKAGALAVGLPWTSVDAKEALDAFMVGGTPHRGRFLALMGRLTAQFPPGRFRAYGEMVNVLAEAGNWGGALELERLWNEYGRSHGFTLLCGYSARHLADAPHALVRHVCLEHQSVEASRIRSAGVLDLLGPEAARFRSAEELLVTR